MRSRAVQITRSLFYVLAAVWLVLGVGYILRSQQRTEDWLIAGMMIANIPVFILLGANITKKPIYWLAVFILLACIFLTIFDEFGIADFIALILFTSPAALMLYNKNEFSTSQENP